MALSGRSVARNLTSLTRGIEGAKRFFFDRAEVLARADAARLKALSKFGAFVRRKAISSIRPKKGPSPPGSPPHTHTYYHSKKQAGPTGKPRKRYFFRDSILFSYDPGRYGGGVVVGPFKFNSSPADPTVPHLHEFGGQARLRDWRPVRVWVAGERHTRWRKVYRTARYPARPYMLPALLAELPKFVHLFKGSMGGRAAA